MGNKFKVGEYVMFEWLEGDKSRCKVIEENKKDGTLIIEDRNGFKSKVFPEQLERCSKGKSK